jgi:hypothetical protein
MENVKVIEADRDGIVSAGQAAAKVVEQVAPRQDMAVWDAQHRSVTPMAMLDRALASGASLETLDKLFALQERWEASQARKAFDEAMAAAKAEIPVIAKNRTVDFTSTKGRTHYRYEDLAEIARTINPILGKYGLSYRFRTTAQPNEPVIVTCIISHRLGYFEENTLTGPRDESGQKNSLQQVGSTLSYLQRMTLKAALGLAAAEDDDGRAGGNSEDAGAITEEQVAKVRSLIKETSTDEPAFLKWLDVEKVEDIPASQMKRIEDSFAVKKRRMAS